MRFAWHCGACEAAGDITAEDLIHAEGEAIRIHHATSPRCAMVRVGVSPAGDGLDKPAHDPVNHPRHYTSHPSGVECIDVAEHYGFAIGNCIKYLWRAGLKGDAVEDLKKARWYLDREIQRREKEQAK